MGALEGRRLPRRPGPPYIRSMNLELTDEQAEALIRGLRKLIDDDRYPPVHALWY